MAVDLEAVNPGTPELTLTFEDFPSICRTCLGASTHSLLSIQDTQIDNIPISTLLETCLFVKVKQDDQFPPNICMECVHLVSQLNQFKQTVANNEQILKIVLENTSLHSTFEDKELNDVADKQEHNVKDELPPDTVKEPETNEVKAKRFRIQFCKVCPTLKAFKTSAEYKRHCTQQHGARMTICETCGKSVHSNHLRVHMRTHSGEKPFQCDMCPAKFSTRANLRRHRMIHTGERPYLCSHCGKSFIQSNELKDHLNTHLPPECRKSKFRKSGTPKAEKNVECDICVKKFSSGGALKKHMVTHYDDRKFPCTMCGKAFKTKYVLDCHVRLHTGEKPYACSYCGQEFTQNGTLTSHLLKHMNIKDHRCTYCARTFRQRSHLKKHLALHTGERPFVCPVCDSAFSFNSVLNAHMKTHTVLKPKVCVMCEESFPTSAKLKKHIQEKHI